MWLQLSQVAVINAGEQVMLNLQVQPTSEQIHEIIIWGHIVSSENLVNKEVFRKLFRSMRCQMIDLRADHEANWEQVHRNDWEQEALNWEAVEEEGDDMDHEEVEGEPGF